VDVTRYHGAALSENLKDGLAPPFSSSSSAGL
jgi:hypothetical protein